MNPFRTREFQSLHKAWTQKLEAEGFKDIEESTAAGEMLKTWDSHYFASRYEPDIFSARQEYFELAERYIKTGYFESDLEKRVWTLHAKGHYLREIARMLRTKNNHINKDNVHAIVARVRSRMGVG